MGRPERTDVAAKVVIVIVARTQKNTYIKGNVIRSWSISDAKVSDVARAIEPCVKRLRKRLAK